MRSKLKPFTIALCATLLCASAAYAQPTIHLTEPGRAAIWHSLGKNATDTSVAAGLQVGETVPEPMRVLPFDRHLRQKVPAIRAYSYALLQGQVLIVDRRTRKIVAIVSR